MKSRIKFSLLLFILISFIIQNVLSENQINDLISNNNNNNNIDIPQETNNNNKLINQEIRDTNIINIQEPKESIINNSLEKSEEFLEKDIEKRRKYDSNKNLDKSELLINNKTNEQKSLAVDILYFEVGILVVFVFSIYWINQRKKQILSQNNEKLSKYLNKV